MPVPILLTVAAVGLTACGGGDDGERAGSTAPIPHTRDQYNEGFTIRELPGAPSEARLLADEAVDGCAWMLVDTEGAVYTSTPEEFADESEGRNALYSNCVEQAVKDYEGDGALAMAAHRYEEPVDASAPQLPPYLLIGPKDDVEREINDIADSQRSAAASPPEDTAPTADSAPSLGGQEEVEPDTPPSGRTRARCGHVLNEVGDDVLVERDEGPGSCSDGRAVMQSYFEEDPSTQGPRFAVRVDAPSGASYDCYGISGVGRFAHECRSTDEKTTFNTE